MNFQDIIKPLSLLPAQTTNDSPFYKGLPVVAGTVPFLHTYLSVPAFTVNEVNYARRLLFQINFSFTSKFYIVNAIQMFDFSSILILGGCLCVKWRQGTINLDGIQVPNVMRYRLLDYRTDLNWSGFPLYTNAVVSSNFCLEFWADNVNTVKGISQAFLLQTSALTIPGAIDDGDIIYPIDSGITNLPQLVQPFPLVFPINWSNQAFLDNV